MTDGVAAASLDWRGLACDGVAAASLDWRGGRLLAAFLSICGQVVVRGRLWMLQVDSLKSADEF